MKIKDILLSIVILTQIACSNEIKEKAKTNKTEKSTIKGVHSFLDGYNPIDNDGNVNVVIEIPAGTIEKWEVDKKTGHLKWEIRNNKPRLVNYLGYPFNYGMIPKTLLTKELGGDGDPIDVIVLGPAVKRGEIVKTKIIGVLKLLDNNEQDDKLIAVMENTPFYKVNSINELQATFNGVTDIVETFICNYKGPGKMKSLGFLNNVDAKKILDYSIQVFEKNN